MPESTRPTANKTCFFYGTLMVPSVLTRVIYGTTRPEPYQTKDLRIRPAVLHDYVRRKVRYADYPGIIPEKGSTVRGTLVEGLTEWDMRRLDAFEGSEYTIGTVKVHVVGREAPVITSTGLKNYEGDKDWKDPEGETDVEAMTYIYSAGAHRLEPEMWDFNHFIKERLYLWAGDDSAEYSEVDQLAWLTGGEYQTNTRRAVEIDAKEDEQLKKSEKEKKVEQVTVSTSTSGTARTPAPATSKQVSAPTVPAVEAA